jgi:hypothetical protein
VIRSRRTPGHAGNQPAHISLDRASATTLTGTPTGPLITPNPVHEPTGSRRGNAARPLTGGQSISAMLMAGAALGLATHIQALIKTLIKALIG